MYVSIVTFDILLICPHWFQFTFLHCRKLFHNCTFLSTLCSCLFVGMFCFKKLSNHSFSSLMTQEAANFSTLHNKLPKKSWRKYWSFMILILNISNCLMKMDKDSVGFNVVAPSQMYNSSWVYQNIPCCFWVSHVLMLCSNDYLILFPRCLVGLNSVHGFHKLSLS